MDVLLDTNIIIEHLQSGLLQDTPDEIRFAISVVTMAELLRLPGIGHDEVYLIEDFISLTKVIDVDASIARKAAFLGRTSKTRLPDLLIAATCIEYRLPLITKNLKDYANLSDLEVRDEI